MGIQTPKSSYPEGKMAQDSSHRRHYDIGLEPGTANYVPLTPLSFLARAAGIYPQRPACIHGSRQITYAQMYGRCRRLASALQARGIGVGDTVSVMAPNVPAMLEAHYGVPMIRTHMSSFFSRKSGKNSKNAFMKSSKTNPLNINLKTFY